MEVGTFEAKRRLSASLDEVAGRGEVIVTWQNEPIGRAVPARPGPDRDTGATA